MPIWLTRTFRGRTALVAIVVFPVLFGALIVAALAPAFDAADRIPVAVVNLDKGAVDASGKKVTYGQDFVDSLMDSAELAWSEVDTKTADAGLADGTYELSLTIPASYSEDVVSVNTDKPRQATLELASGTAGNPLASTAGSAVVRQVQARLKSDLGQNYILSVLSEVRGQAARLSMVADGSVFLDTAFDGLKQGTNVVADSLQQTAVGTSALAGGVQQIADGVTALGSGSTRLAQGMQMTADGLTPLAQGAAALTSGMTAIADTTDQMGASLVDMGDQLQTLTDGLTTAMSDLTSAGQSAATIASSGAHELQIALMSTTQAHERIASLADRLEGISSVQATMTQLTSDAQGLATTLSHSAAGDGSDAGGLVEQLEALNARYDTLTNRLVDALSSDTDAGDTSSETGDVVSGSNAEDAADGISAATDTNPDTMDTNADASTTLDVNALIAEIQEVRDERQVVIGQLKAASSTAQTLSETASSAAVNLTDAADAQTELSGALDTYDESANAAEEALQSVQLSALSMIKPTANATMNIVAVQTALAGTTLPNGTQVPGLASTVAMLGHGVSGIASQLASTGALGAGVSGIARSVEPLSVALEGFASASSGIGQGTTALGQALQGINQGVGALGTGMSTLASVEAQMGDGVGQLQTAVSSMTEAASTARDNLTKETSSYRDRAEVAASPVRIVSTATTSLNISSALVPIVLVGVVWLGAMLATLLLPGLSRRTIIAGGPILAVIEGAGSYFALVFVQAVIVTLVSVLFGLIPSEAIVPVILLMLGTVLSSACTAFVSVCFTRRAGVVILLALLIVQLLGAGAILPSVFSTPLFAVLGNVMPLSATATALREVFAGASLAFVPAVVVCAVWTIATLVLAVLITQTQRHVHPEKYN